MPFLIIVTQTIMCVMKNRPRTLGGDTLSSIERVRQEIVAFLGRKKIRREDKPCGTEEADDGADCAQIKGGVQVPSGDGELVVVIVKVSLAQLAYLPRLWTQ